jgi:hypothetical protein
MLHGGRATPGGNVNRVEAVIRAYDPCLSCSTHALGKMPFRIQLAAPDGTVLGELVCGGVATHEETETRHERWRTCSGNWTPLGPDPTRVAARDRLRESAPRRRRRQLAGGATARARARRIMGTTRRSFRLRSGVASAAPGFSWAPEWSMMPRGAEVRGQGARVQRGAGTVVLVAEDAGRAAGTAWTTSSTLQVKMCVTIRLTRLPTNINRGRPRTSF